MKLLAVDGNSILNRAFYGIKLLSNSKGEFTNACVGFLNILNKVKEDVNPDIIVAAFDLRAPTFRHSKVDYYKANRKGMPEELAQQLPKIKSILKYMGIKILEMPGYEADDILGTLAKEFTKDFEENHCYILTGDRDSLQLIDDRVTVKLATNKENINFTKERFAADYQGLEPRQLIELKALMGDSSDNIKGVAGVGEKTAMDLIVKFSGVENLYRLLEAKDAALDGVKPGVKLKLEGGKAAAFESHWLATIDQNIPLDCSLEALTQPGNPAKLSGILRNLEMLNWLDKLGLKAVTPDFSEETPDGKGTDKEILEEEPPQQTPTKTLLSPEALAAMESLGEAAGLKIPPAKELLEPLLQPLTLQENAPQKTLSEGWQEGALVVFLLEGEWLYLAQNSLLTRINVAEGNQGLLEEFFKSPCPKATVGSKDYYRKGLDMGAPLKNLILDGELAAYLLSSTPTEPNVERLGALRQMTLDGSLGDFAAIGLLPKLLFNLAVEVEENAMSHLLYLVEQPLSRVLAHMEQAGVALSAEGVEEFGLELKEELADFEGQIFELAGHSFNVASPKQLGAVLFEEMGLPPKKKTKTGYSTNADVLEELAERHPIIPLIQEHRQTAKLASTYIDGLLKSLGADGRLHSTFKQTETRTGRISSTEPNLQNIPVRTEKGARMREFFIAPKGRVLLDSDYSQIELRIVAALSGDETMKNSFLSGEDIHTSTAAQVFDLPVEMVTPSMRRAAKAVNFGIIYGIGPFSLSKDIGVTVGEAKKYIAAYLEHFPSVKTFMDKTIAAARQLGYVTTIFGRRRYIPELSMTNKNMQAFGERAAMNGPIQGAAADVIKIAMVRVFSRLEREGIAARLILQIHDELIVEAEESAAERASEILSEEMNAAVALAVPLCAQVSRGENWSLAH